jgi:hypothetical protein
LRSIAGWFNVVQVILFPPKIMIMHFVQL